MKKQILGVIKQIDIIKGSADKLNSSMEEVRRGTGVQVSKKIYNRNQLKKEILY